MAFDPITAILNTANTILDRVLPDKAANDAAKAQLVVLQVQGELQQVAAQLAVNQAEAGSQSVFVAGWRPFVGWICGVAFAYAFILQPLMQFLLVAFHSSFDVTKLPSLNLEDMLPVLFGMLGLGAMRSFDKTTGNGNGH
jgi:hypothetical protein